MFEYQVRLHEFSYHATMILFPTHERVKFFACGLWFQLRMEIEPMVAAGCSFLEVVNYARTMNHLYCEAKEGSDKRARH